MILRAKHLHAWVLLPMILCVTAFTVVLRLAFIWFGMNFEQGSFLDFPFYWSRVMNSDAPDKRRIRCILVPKFLMDP